MQRRYFEPVFDNILLAAIYFFSAKLGLSMAYLHVSATAVWPPTGIALAALLLRGYRIWPGVLVGALLANFFNEGNWLTSLAIGCGNTLEALTGAWLINRVAQGKRAFCNIESILAYALCTAFSSTIAATIGVGSLVLGGFAAPIQFRAIWLTWWLGDLVSDFNVAPFFLVWFSTRLPKFNRRDGLEALGLTAALALSGQIIFGGNLRSYPVSFLALPLLIWAAYRFRQHGAVTSNLLMSLIAVWGTVTGFGPFTLGERNQTLLLLEAFMGTISLTGLCLAALVSERGDDEQKLAWYQAVVESSHDAIIGKTLDGTITNWNRSAAEIYGYSAHEVVGRNISVIVPSFRQEELAAIFTALSRGERVEPFETVRIRKDGRHIHVMVSISPVKDKTGKVIGASAIGRDITRRKIAEEEKCEFEERLNLAIEAAKIGTWEWNLATQKIRWSPNLEAIHKLPPGSFGGTLGDLIQDVHPEDRPKLLENIRLALKEKQDFRCEYRIVRGKNVTWLEGRGRLFFDAAGNPERMSGICLDITERKETERIVREEAALRESEARFHQMAEAVPHIIYTARADGSIDYGNRQWFEYTGMSPEQTYTLNGFLGAVHPDDVPTVIRSRESSLHTGQPLRTELRIRGKSGEFRWFFSWAVPVKNESGQLIRWVGSCTDINDQKRAAEFLEQFARDLEEKVAERTGALEKSVEFLEKFLYTIGHHLRAPLRAIDGFTQILLEDYAPAFDTRGKETAERIETAARRMDELIHALLVFGRLSQEELPCESVELDEYVEKVLKHFSEEIRAKNAQVTFTHHLPAVWANKATLEQILENLISNALKFVNSGQRPRIEIWAEEKDGSICLWVKDNGIGIDPAHQTRIFDIFERLHEIEEFPGLGLGLAIVQKAAERMDGEVGVKSEPGKGSSFWVSLPKCSAGKPPLKRRRPPERYRKLRARTQYV